MHAYIHTYIHTHTHPYIQKTTCQYKYVFEIGRFSSFPSSVFCFFYFSVLCCFYVSVFCCFYFSVFCCFHFSVSSYAVCVFHLIHFLKHTQIYAHANAFPCPSRIFLINTYQRLFACTRKQTCTQIISQAPESKTVIPRTFSSWRQNLRATRARASYAKDD